MNFYSTHYVPKAPQEQLFGSPHTPLHFETEFFLWTLSVPGSGSLESFQSSLALYRWVVPSSWRGGGSRAPGPHSGVKKGLQALRSGSIVANEVYPRRDYC